MKTEQPTFYPWTMLVFSMSVSKFWTTFDEGYVHSSLCFNRNGEDWTELESSASMTGSKIPTLKIFLVDAL